METGAIRENFEFKFNLYENINGSCKTNIGMWVSTGLFKVATGRTRHRENFCSYRTLRSYQVSALQEHE